MIADISDEAQFTIKTVSKQTGILPVTIRAWERRFHLLTPQRADNRYRMYSERDVVLLKWIQASLKRGISISKAVISLKANLDNGVLPDIALEPAPTIEAGQAQPPSIYAQRLYKALIIHDDAEADNILQAAHSIFDLVIVFERVIIPCMFEIGEAWRMGNLSITSEHMASSFIKAKLMSLLNAYPNRRNPPVILVGCAPFEQHEIGTLMMAILLRRSGQRVEYLGTDVPLDDLLDYARREHPAMILLSASIEQNALELVGFEKRLKALKPAPLFAYGGSCFNRNPILQEKVQGIFLGPTFNESLDRVQTLLK
jgi:MerR family transcriptional regulator, light-induced transcriptional regulator